MRKPLTIAVLFSAPIITALFALFYYNELDKSNDSCKAGGGVLVKTFVDGYVCIEAEVVKD